MYSNPNLHDAPSYRWWAGIEIVLIFLLFFLFSGWPPPDVNEAHYLAKAKHYWTPEWCAGDSFLESSDAHLVFYWTFGWLTRWLSLPATAWVGRFLVWGLQAWSWQRLSRAIVPVPMASLLTAALFLLFTQWFHMAGEWVVGGVEAKGVAYALVFFALERMLRNRWNVAWLLLGAATSFHVLVGGWSMVAAGFAWFSCRQLRPPLRSMLPAMVAGVLLALPGLLPALALDQSGSAEIAQQANWIYVYERLSHHLVFWRFPHVYMARQALLLVAWIGVCMLTPCPLDQGELGQRPLRGFVAGAVLIALVGIVIDQSLLRHLDLAASLLRYYWYRLSDAMLPVGAALSLVAALHVLARRRPTAAQVALIISVVAATGNLALIQVQRRDDMRPRAVVQMLPSVPGSAERTQVIYDDWRDACAWIADNTPSDARFITPRMQQTFKWYAGRSEVCAWKDIPQDAAGLVNWWEQIHELYTGAVNRAGLAIHGEERLVELARKHGADYIVIDRSKTRRRLLLPRVYPTDPFESSSYEVYRVP